MILTALIVTDRQEFFRRCESPLNANNVYAQLSSFHLQESKRKLEMAQPDILLVDALINGHATELIEQLMEHPMPRKPALFLYLKERTPSWERFFLCKGVMYIFDKSMHEHNMIECMMHLYTLHRSLEREDELMPELVRILRECCVSPRYRGYACIFDSVRLVLNQAGHARLLTKKIYPHIAIKHHTTATRVEKNIRDSVRNAWENGGKQVMPVYLGCGQEKPPTNGQFIAAACEKLREVLSEKEKSVSKSHTLI